MRITVGLLAAIVPAGCVPVPADSPVQVVTSVETAAPMPAAAPPQGAVPVRIHAPRPPTGVITEPAPLPPLVVIPSRSAPAPSGDVYYPNCSAARASGAAPVFAGEPGYRGALDPEGDGVGCD